MDRPDPPRIFSPARRRAVRRRMLALQQREGAGRYLLDDMVEDVTERLGFLRHQPAHALVIGDHSAQLGRWLRARGSTVHEAEPALGFDEESPFPQTGFDFIASLGTLDTVNDLPGALIHLRAALAQGGLMIASFVGAGSLAGLRTAMFAADADRPAPRLHPMVDVRAGGQLLQRAGFADPVIDSRSVDVRFRSLASLLADLRAQGLSNVLADPGPTLTRQAHERARQDYGASHLEHFEIVTLSGWRR